MKKFNLTLLLITILFLTVKAQDVDDNPVAYMNAMNKSHLDMDKKYMQYTSAVAHGKRARKVEKLRLQVLENISSTRDKISDLPFYKGDKTYRQSNLDYVDFIYKIFSEDYVKIVNVEEIAEQSIDELQAYLLLKEKIDEKLKLATETINKAGKDFAAKYKINLVAGEKSDLDEKLEQASKVNKYYKPIHIIFFKCNWSFNKLTQALNDKKVNDAEQARGSVIKFADEGIIELDKIQSFEGDGSMKMACKQLLMGFKNIAQKESLVQIEFILKNENFEKLKKTFEAKDESSRTKEDVDAFNKSVNELNAAVKNVNTANDNSNNKANELRKNWDETVNSFFDGHTPKY